MGLIDQVMQDDNIAFFDSDSTASVYTVTFRPWNQDTREIDVHIIEGMPTPEEEANRIKEVMLVSVKNHATLGISSSAFNAGKDRIDLSYRPGETAKTYVLGMPVSMDSGQMIFRVK